MSIGCQISVRCRISVRLMPLDCLFPYESRFVLNAVNVFDYHTERQNHSTFSRSMASTVSFIFHHYLTLWNSTPANARDELQFCESGNVNEVYYSKSPDSYGCNPWIFALITAESERSGVRNWKPMFDFTILREHAIFRYPPNE